MDTNRLRYFSTIVRNGSFTEAARILGVSPAALSKSMRVLEQELHTRLFVPAGRGIEVTPEGQALALQAELIVEQVNRLKRGLLDAQVERKTLRLASFEVFTTYFLGAAIQRHLHDYSVEALELIPGELERSLVSRQSDLGITYLPIPMPELDIIKVTSTAMEVYGVAKFADVPFQRLPFVIPMAPLSGSPTKVRGLDGWPDHEHPRSIAYRVTLMETALDLCRRGLAVAYLPRFVARLHNERAKSSCVLSALPHPMRSGRRRQDVFLIKRKSDPESALARRLAKAIRQICQD